MLRQLTNLLNQHISFQHTRCSFYQDISRYLCIMLVTLEEIFIKIVPHIPLGLQKQICKIISTVFENKIIKYIQMEPKNLHQVNRLYVLLQRHFIRKADFFLEIIYYFVKILIYWKFFVLCYYFFRKIAIALGKNVKQIK